MKTPLLFIICLLVTTTMTAQSWQWGRRGGAAGNSTSPAQPDNIVDMDTDPNGNVYIAAIINSSSPVSIGNTPLNTYGATDIFIASYTCNGSLRWKKVFGGGDWDGGGLSLRTDSIGHVFVSGAISSSFLGTHFDTDTVLPNTNYKEGFLIQYDTSGTYKWLRQPTPDTVPSIRTNMYGSYDMYASKNGDITLLTYLSSGLLAGGGNHVVTTPGVYFLNYNAAGAITSVVPVQMSVSENNISAGPATSFNNIRMVKTKSGKVIVSGRQQLDGPTYTSHFSMGGTLITHSMFIGCFNGAGQFLWKKENVKILGGGIAYRPISDIKSNIYINAGSPHGDSLGNYPFINHINNLPYYALPSVIKIDSSGNILFGKNAGVAQGGGDIGSISLINNKIFLSGIYTIIKWDNIWFANPSNGGSDIYMVSFDTATLAVVSADSLKSSTGYNENISAMVSDKNGNLYVGGNFEGDLTVNNTTLNSAGGYSDFFIAKYGAANCGSVMPLQLLSFAAHNTGNSNLLQWTTAQEINVDRFEIERAASLTPQRGELEFAAVGLVPTKALNGNNTTTLSYHYTDEPPAGGRGNLFYRLKMIDKDGKFTYSNIVSVKMPAANGVSIYPNPAREVLHVQVANRYNELLTVQVTDMQGKVLQQQVVATVQGNTGFTISTGGLAPGSYLLVIKGSEKRVVKFVKEK